MRERIGHISKKSYHKPQRQHNVPFKGVDDFQLNRHLNLENKTETSKTKSFSIDIILRFHHGE